MSRPDPRTLLEAWERGLAQSPQHRVLTLLAVFMPERSRGELAALPVGRRDSALLDMREKLFGPTLAAMVSCPSCGEDLEAEVPLGEIRTRSAADDGKVRTMSARGHILSFRLPTTEDLLAIVPGSSMEEARALLLGRCVTGARDERGEALDPTLLPEPVVRALAARMAKADPQADISLSLDCPDCGHGFAALLDVAAFLLRDLHGWAQRTLGEVHAIASAYGWSEKDIMELSPARRRIYVELAAR